MKETSLFFKYAVEAIAEEDKELRSLFVENCDVYADHCHGVAILYETTYVYLILKNLLRNKFPLKVIWEYPFPTNHYKHADLVLKRDDEIVAFVEFKIWKREDDSEIVSDIKKLENDQLPGDKFIFIITFGGPTEKNIQYLTTRNKELRLLFKEQLLSNLYANNRRSDVNLDLFLFQIETQLS